MTYVPFLFYLNNPIFSIQLNSNNKNIAQYKQGIHFVVIGNTTLQDKAAFETKLAKGITLGYLRYLQISR